MRARPGRGFDGEAVAAADAARCVDDDGFQPRPAARHAQAHGAAFREVGDAGDRAELRGGDTDAAFAALALGRDGGRRVVRSP